MAQIRYKYIWGWGKWQTYPNLTRTELQDIYRKLAGKIPSNPLVKGCEVRENDF